LLRRLTHRRRALTWLAAALAALAALAAGCSTSSGIKTSDIVDRVPWTAPETRRYELRIDNDPAGETTLSIRRDGDTFVLSQLSADDTGNSDGSITTVDAATLKPRANEHTVIDKDQKRVALARYDDVSTDECASGRIARIEQQVYDPPDEQTPDSTRGGPLCVPEHAYDNDSSLFIWRTIKFEQGYEVSYTSVISNRREKRTITLRVNRIEQVQTPAGEFDAWRVDIIADNVHQTAWFSTDDDRHLVAYQNQSFYFRLKE